MELDDLKLQWQALDRKLESTLSLERQVLGALRAQTSRRSLRLLWMFQPVQIVLGVALAMYFGRFWSTNLASPALWISGVVLHALSIALVVDAAVRISLIRRIDYSAPVMTIQRDLAKLRYWEVRSFKWAWVLVWVAIPAMLVVAAKQGADVDLARVWPSAIWWTAAGSCIGVALSYAFDRWARRRSLGARLERFYSGDAIARAQAAFDENEAFARE